MFEKNYNLMEAFKAFLSSGFSVAELTQRAPLTT
jgi:hypothetical protein